MLRAKNNTIMKKNLFFILLLLVGFIAQAQVFEVDPASKANPVKAGVPAFKAQAGDAPWWGLLPDNDDRTGLGTQTTETYFMALKVSDHVAGKQVKAVKFYLRSLSVLSDVKIFFSKTLPDDVASADYLQDLDKANLKGGDASTYVMGLPNVVELSTPYTIPEGGCYAGISFKVTSTSSSAGQYPVVIYSQGKPDGLWLRTSTKAPQWFDATSFGTLALQLQLTGDYADNALIPNDFGKQIVGVNKPVTIPVELYSLGSEGASDIDYTATIDGVETESFHLQLPSVINTFEGKTVDLTLPAQSEMKEYPVTITINKVNGQENLAQDKMAEGTLNVVSEIYPRNVLIEEFTTERCPNCPRVAGFLHEALKDYDPAQVAAVCHHAGYYTDWLTQPCDNELTWLYNDNGSVYAPALMFNRQPIFDSQYIQGEKDNVTIPGSVMELKGYIDDQLSQKSNLSLDVKAIPNDAYSEVTMTINGKCNEFFDKATSLLTVYVTEDSIKARSQSGGGSNYYQMHVIRYYNSTWGDAITWNGNEFTATYTIKLNSAWKQNKLRFVAMVNKHNKANKLDCRIENSQSVAMGTPGGVNDVVVSGENAYEVARYTIDGRRIQQEQPGINIIQMSDGSIRKVLVK